jgi:hypothetical protein
MKAEALVGRLRGVRWCRDGWMALCPAHADKNPSLSIGEQDGKVLLYCFAGCAVEAICAALRIRVSDLFVELGQRRKPEPSVVRDVQRRISALRSRLTPYDRTRGIVVITTKKDSLDAAIARALALAVEGELAQVVLQERKR